MEKVGQKIHLYQTNPKTASVISKAEQSKKAAVKSDFEVSLVDSYCFGLCFLGN